MQRYFKEHKTSINHSINFWYGAFTNSSLEIFDEIPVLETNRSSYKQEFFPSTSLDASSFELDFETNRNLYLDMRDTYLSLKLQLSIERWFDAFKIEKKEHKAKSEDDWENEPESYLTYAKLFYVLYSPIVHLFQYY